MKWTREKWLQVAFAVAAAGLLVVAGLLRGPLNERSQRMGSLRRDVVTREHPEIALLTLAPGGLRAPVVNYLWIRIQDLKEAGRYYEAMQLSEWICSLQPRFAGVWSFHAWNMAWNISVATHTPEERWLWVTNGMKLLRDRGIPANPQALTLYKELGWLLFSKMGGTTDDMHQVYKRRWAAEMQRVLGAPPAGSTQEVIAAFRPIAEVPADREVPELLADPNVAQYARKLKPYDVTLEARSFLGAWNRLSQDEAAAVIRFGRPLKAEKPRDKELMALINSQEPADADARAKILATARNRILRDEYRMDPTWMLGLMERLNVPFDWRMVWPHGLYWVTRGLHMSRGLNVKQIDSLNTERILLNSLKNFTWQGRMVYVADPDNPDDPDVRFFSDWRYVEPAHREHVRLIKQSMGLSPDAPDAAADFKNSKLADGHRNYLVNAISMLVAGGQVEQAQKRLDWTRHHYDMSGGIWDNVLVEEFVTAYLTRQGSPIPRIAISQLTVSIQTAFLYLAEGGPQAQQNYANKMKTALRVYAGYQRDVADRLKYQGFDVIARDVLASLLIEPRAFGFRLSLVDRATLYQSLPEGFLVPIYDAVAPYLRAQCRSQDPPLDFEAAFPAPQGLEQFREEMRKRFPTREPRKKGES